MAKKKYVEVKFEKNKVGWYLSVFGHGQDELAAIGEAIRGACKGKVEIRNIADPLAFPAKKRKARVSKVTLPTVDGANAQT